MPREAKTKGKRMKIYLTPRFADYIEEVETLGDPTGDVFDYDAGDRFMGGVWKTHHWYKEGETWHRTRAAAVKALAQYRQERIAKAAAEIARLTQLPAIT